MKSVKKGKALTMAGLDNKKEEYREWMITKRPYRRRMNRNKANMTKQENIAQHRSHKVKVVTSKETPFGSKFESLEEKQENEQKDHEVMINDIQNEKDKRKGVALKKGEKS